MNHASPANASAELQESTAIPVDVLWRLASSARLYRSPDGRLHAQVKVGECQEFFGINSADFREWLIDAYFADCGQPPSERAIARVISVVKARARFSGGTPSVFIRVGREQGDNTAFYLDLSDKTGRGIWICGEGWCVVDKPEVQFRRPAGQLALPLPGADGSIDLLRKYVNVSEPDFRLLVAWITAALRPVGPYPVLVLHGEQGSAKTTLAKIVRLLIDPQDCPLLAEPKSTRDLMATAANGWVISYDNLNILQPWLSDSLCRLVSGGGFAARALYSNDERHVISAQRPVILNGIEEFVRRGDLIDRSVFLQLAPIAAESRRAEDEFWSEFDADYPRILGGVLNAVAGGLRELPSVRLSKLPRMADYAKWGESVGRALGWDADVFSLTYESNRRQAINPALEDSLIGTALLEMGPRLVKFWGGPADLLRELMYHVDRRDVAEAQYLSPAMARRKCTALSARWPKDTRLFSKELRRVLPLLRPHGICANFTRGNRGSGITFTYTAPRPEEEDVA